MNIMPKRKCFEGILTGSPTTLSISIIPYRSFKATCNSLLDFAISSAKKQSSGVSIGCVPYGSLFDEITSFSFTTSSVAIPVEGLSTITSTRRCTSSSFACGGGSFSVTATKRTCDSSFKYSLTAFDAVVISLIDYERCVV